MLVLSVPGARAERSRAVPRPECPGAGAPSAPGERSGAGMGQGIPRDPPGLTGALPAPSAPGKGEFPRESRLDSGGRKSPGNRLWPARGGREGLFSETFPAPKQQPRGGFGLEERDAWKSKFQDTDQSILWHPGTIGGKKVTTIKNPHNTEPQTKGSHLF